MGKRQVTRKVCEHEAACEKCHDQIRVGEQMIVVSNLEPVTGIGLSSSAELVPTTAIAYHTHCLSP